MKKSQLKQLIRNILKEEIDGQYDLDMRAQGMGGGPTPAMSGPGPGIRSQKHMGLRKRIMSAPTNKLKVTAIVDHYRSLNMDDNAIKNHLSKVLTIKNTPGCSALNEQVLPNRGPSKGPGGEERLIGWILGCAAVIGLLNAFGVGQGGGGGDNIYPDDCIIDPSYC